MLAEGNCEGRQHGCLRTRALSGEIRSSRSAHCNLLTRRIFREFARRFDEWLESKIGMLEILVLPLKDVAHRLARDDGVGWNARK